MNIKQTILTGIAAIALSANAQTNSPTFAQTQTNLVTDGCTNKIKEFAIDQVLRDHDGIRIIYTDAHNIVREMKAHSRLEDNGEPCFFPHCTKPALDTHRSTHFPTYVKGDRVGYGIVRDLPAGFQMKALQIKLSNGHFYTEIHMPKGGMIKGGTETWGGKYKTHGTIKEIK